MPGAEFFINLGLFVDRKFLDAQSCSTIRSALMQANKSSASVVDGETYEERVKDVVRKTKQATVSPAIKSIVKARLHEVTPVLKAHFNLELEGYESPQFLIYEEGDFFSPHPDRGDEEEKPRYIRDRKVSVVIFLNDSSGATPSYSGGALTLYGLIKDAGWERFGFPVDAETGLMIAFRSEVVHEVTRITQGERFSIVSWYF